MNPTEPYQTQSTSGGPGRAPGRGPVAHVGRVHAAGGVHEGVLRLDDHLGRGHHVRERGRARVALRQPQPHRDVVLHALRRSHTRAREASAACAGHTYAPEVSAAHRPLPLQLRPAQVTPVLGRCALRTGLCCYALRRPRPCSGGVRCAQATAAMPCAGHARARGVLAAHRPLQLRPAQVTPVLGRRPLRTGLCCFTGCPGLTAAASLHD